jgi:hypothetical protein
MIFGGIANSIYGNTRQTFDIDVKLDLTDEQKKYFLKKLETIAEILPNDPIQFMNETSVLPIEIKGIKADLVFANLPFEKNAIKNSVEDKTYGFTFQVCRAEDLILQKVVSTREKDWQDIESLIKLNKEKLDWNYLLKHCQELADFLSVPSILNKVKKFRDEY